MKHELKTVVVIAGVAQTPITVFVHENDYDLNPRIDLIDNCYTRRHKQLPISTEHKAAIITLLTKMREKLNTHQGVCEPTLLTMDEVELTYSIYPTTLTGEGAIGHVI